MRDRDYELRLERARAVGIALARCFMDALHELQAETMQAQTHRQLDRPCGQDITEIIRAIERGDPS